jgi:hypothetical protein
MSMEQGETLYQYLERRERELSHQIAALKGEIGTREHELAHVRSAKRQIGQLGTDDKARFGVPGSLAALGAATTRLSDLAKPVGISLSALGEQMSEGGRKIAEALQAGAIGIGPFPLTIKQLIMRALLDHFRQGGATVTELRQFILDAHGRDIDRTSLSPQLTRLRNEGHISLVNGRWVLGAHAHDDLTGASPYGLTDTSDD